MALCIRERIFSWAETYDVTDENQKPRYFVTGEGFSFGHKIHIYDENHQEVAYIHEKVWSFLKKFEIYIRGEKKGIIAEKFSFFRPRYKVDFLNCEITGNIFEWDYSIQENGMQVASISRKILSWANVFYLDFDKVEDEVPFLALAIAIDAAHRDNQNASYVSMGN
jgi:uncharacterized protein YxjI